MRRQAWINPLAFVLCFGALAGANPSRAQEKASAAAQPAAPIEADAMAALQRMGTYLRTLNAFAIKAETTIDEVTDEGEKLQFGGTVMLQAQRPDKLRADVESDRKQRQIFYDGKALTLFGPRVGYYASVPASGTIRDVLDVVEQKYGLRLPLADLFRWGTDEAALAAVREAAIIGPARIDGVPCDHVAVRQQGVDWQVWIEQGKAPLPRKLVITTLSEAAQPQYVSVMHWDVAPKFAAETFLFVPPKGASRIKLRETAAATQ